jgi:hypothetical protein
MPNDPWSMTITEGDAPPAPVMAPPAAPAAGDAAETGSGTTFEIPTTGGEYERASAAAAEVARKIREDAEAMMRGEVEPPAVEEEDADPLVREVKRIKGLKDAQTALEKAQATYDAGVLEQGATLIAGGMDAGSTFGGELGELQAAVINAEFDLVLAEVRSSAATPESIEQAEYDAEEALAVWEDSTADGKAKKFPRKTERAFKVYTEALDKVNHLKAVAETAKGLAENDGLAMRNATQVLKDRMRAADKARLAEVEATGDAQDIAYAKADLDVPAELRRGWADEITKEFRRQQAAQVEMIRAQWITRANVRNKSVVPPVEFRG